MAIRWEVRLLCVLVVGLMVAGCGAATPEATEQITPQMEAPASPQGEAQGSPLSVPPPAAPADVQTSPLAAPSPVPVVATATPAVDTTALVILHTNDNWGETEPCG